MNLVSYRKNRSYHSKYRSEPIKKASQYLLAVTNKEKDTIKNNLRSILTKLNHQDVLMIQSNKSLWEQLMLKSDYHLRRILCKKLFNLNESHLMDALSYSSGSANQLFSKTGIPDLTRAFQIGMLFGHPWQMLNKNTPDELSYSSFSEYYYHGVAKRINFKTLGNEKSNVKSITGYVITDPQKLFRQELTPVTGRWVTTFPEMDYFEFHLTSELLLDKQTLKKILSVFPEANDVVGTYIPFRPQHTALWIMTQKPGMESQYNRIKKELAEYRYKTAFLYTKS